MKLNTKRQLLLIIFLFEIIQSLQAQQVSVLSQFFAANPIIKRDPEFENLQKYLFSAKQNTTLGLSENITKKIDDLKKNIDKIRLKLRPVKDSLVGGTKTDFVELRWNYFGKNGREIYSLADFNSKRSEFIKAVTDVFVNEILSKYPAITEATSSKIVFNQMILYLISSSLTASEIDIKSYSDTNNASFNTSVRTNLLNFFEKLLNVSEPLKLEDLDLIIANLNALIENMKGKILDGIYQIQEAIDKAKGDISNALVSANTGVGVNRDEGAFGGGLVLTFRSDNIKKKNNFQGGVFVSGVGQAGASDTSHVKQPFLCGVQLDWQLWESTQISVLSSYRYNQQKIGNQNWLFEVGAGFLSKTSSDIIWGISAYYQSLDAKVKSTDNLRDFKLNSLFTCGLTLRGSSNTSPVILLGASYQKDWVPVMQISYPVNFTKQ
ncbi:MAG: hypothetical protein JSS79_13825 [Bacteroidetes bacterium]|nr:hypothetical protein [Bacteroidota bacterium]